MDEWFPWERLPEETGPAWAAFVIYRDLGPSRTLEKAAKTLGKHSSTLSEFGRKWNWEPRVRAWDAEVDRARRKSFLELQTRTVGEHLDAARKMRELAMRTVHEYEDHHGGQPMPPSTALEFIKAAVKIEQAALGLPSEPQQSIDTRTPEEIYFDNLGERELLKEMKTSVKVLEGKLEPEKSEHAKPASRKKQNRRNSPKHGG